MRYWFPYPLLSLSLLALWLLINQSLSTGHILLGSTLGISWAWIMVNLQPDKTRLRKFRRIAVLTGHVVIDVLRSNLTVMRVILRSGSRPALVRADQTPLRGAAEGDIRMNELFIIWSMLISQILIGLAMACALFRIVRGPRAQDRILGLDALYINAMLLLLTFGIRTANSIYFEAALIIALLGFVSSIAFAKFLMRGEVIE
jgi:multisubunit Na+/H+ antiporter MnhF subunit